MKWMTNHLNYWLNWKSLKNVFIVKINAIFKLLIVKMLTSMKLIIFQLYKKNSQIEFLEMQKSIKQKEVEVNNKMQYKF